MSTLNSLTALEAHRLLCRGDISSEEITRDCLRRIGAVEPLLKAFVTVTEELGPFAGAQSRSNEVLQQWRSPGWNTLSG